MDLKQFKPKAFFVMRAYNAERYIEEAIDSILNQSEANFLFLLQDNGSTDRTKEICKEYAKRDSRILLYRNEINGMRTEKEIKDYDDKIKICMDAGAEYFAILDSDDFYHKDFLRITYSVAKEQDADMVVCGSTFIDETGIKMIGNRIPPNLIIKDKRISEDDFINLYGSLRPVWGKLYSCKIYNNFINISNSKPKKLHSGTDTFIILTLMNEINTFISVNKVLHTYRVRKTSTYHSDIDKYRIKEGDILFQKGVMFAEVYNAYSQKTKIFLYSVYFNHIKDLISIVCTSTMSAKDKIEYITAIADERLFYYSSRIFNDVEPFLFNSLAIILKNLSPIERARAEGYYIVRYYNYHFNQNEDKQSEALLLSVYCDELNICGWGSSRWQGISKTNKDYLISTVNNEIITKHNLAKNEMIEAIESNNWDKAIDKLSFLTEELPLSIDTLYFQMYIFYNFNDLENAIRISNIANIFYGNDEEISNIISIINKCSDTTINK
jgi:glycosyltransferase involved in cell wall biosynthesis